ncbi:MAG: nidogen-like domain-containing protein [Flavobacteriales bacterium]
MKKLIYLCVMVAGTSFAQKNSVSISSSEYDQLKKSGQLNSSAVYQFSDLVTPNKIKPIPSTNKNALCGCMLTLDNTYTLAMTPNDDWSSGFITLPFSFDFYGTLYDSVVINNNGNVSFLAPYFEYTANAFPDPTFNMIAPFWGDVDTRSASGGNVWYKVTNDALIVIWDHVGYYNMHDSLTNTFQLVISNGQDTIIHGNNNISFCYGDMQWTTGDASSGFGGFGGFAATVGVNIGNGVDFFQVGQFDAPGTGFDGPYGLADQVDFLDDQEVYFDIAGMNAANIPPLVINSNICDTIDVYTGDTLHKSNTTASFEISVLTPEYGQMLSTQINSDAPNALTSLQGGNGTTYISYACEFNPQGLSPGIYHVTIEASDNGTPMQHTSYSVPIRVHEGASAGIFEPNLDGFTLYPNPTDGHIQWKHATKTLHEVVVFGMDGTAVYREEFPSNEIDLSFLSEGMYLLYGFGADQSISIQKFELLK